MVSKPAGSGKSFELKRELRGRPLNLVAAVANPDWRKCAALAEELRETAADAAAIAVVEMKRGDRAEAVEEAVFWMARAAGRGEAPVLVGTCHAVRRALKLLGPAATGRIYVDEVGQCQPIQLACLLELGLAQGRQKLKAMFQFPPATLFRFHENVARVVCDLF